MSKSKQSNHESTEEKKARSFHIVKLLKKEFPHAVTALHHANAFQLLIATILSAQCTDERVNMVVPGLFKKYRTVKAFANASQAELEQDIRSTGFFRMKSKSIIGCSKALLEHFGGEVPQTIDDLVTLPGVGRKTANVVLGQVFGIASGVVVDTHVFRLSQRLGFSSSDTAEKIEIDLMNLFPKKYWIDLGSILILHGRKTCAARSPKCEDCVLNQLCPSAEEFLATKRRS
ncbi:MAG: endonuclease III [Ignavibacteriae bacterium]|nr:endonuclease III [Ignavibacteriota bacterium]